MVTPMPVADRARLALLRIDRPAAIGLVVLAVLAVLVAVVLTIRSSPQEIRVSGDGSPIARQPVGSTASAESLGSSPIGTGAASTSTEVVVDVAGRVRRPGLVRVPAGSRVADVIEAAGGFQKRSDARSVNQARVVTDGEQVLVGPGAPVGGSSTAGGGARVDAAPIDLNTATLEQLETLPGVGPVLAQRILDHRTATGRFNTVEELRDVSGIGEKTFADLAPRVRV